ncbi:hypothetical protein B5X24_HaOG203046 [Helicoverpa armigera]|uniref:Peptidase S1 domain-containing protein n=1 Tax=Helicoverpa armigera TaxID=29058 RepID=A0A2W1BYH9_HELAM|nr:hypothetical protein B5X24_HaOG203046 [Helicoverpa armigera]
MKRYAPMRYIDYSEQYHDFYFDSVVPVLLNEPNWKGNGQWRIPITVGVMITSDRMLVPYNPFRLFIHNKAMLDKITANPLTGRGFQFYFYSTYKIACGRQVIPDDEKRMLHCHGKNGFDCPVHDLMVLRIYGNISFTTMPTLTYSQDPGKEDRPLMHGIYRTEIARPNDTLNDYFKFASLGFKNNEHIKRYYGLEKVEYKLEDYALVDCETWLPRDWGHFICVLNLGDYPALGSGAWLVSDNKVFGIGSFAFFRGKEGIFVFTDVRRYYNLIMNTCTYEDSQEKPPRRFPPSNLDDFRRYKIDELEIP